MSAKALSPVKAVPVFPKPGHDHKVCSTRALREAEQLCETNDVRLTEIRRRVLAAIWNSHKPVGAYDLLQKLAAESGKMAPTTVYRAIDFLIEHGLVHRLSTLNAFIGCVSPGSEHGAHFLICDVCGTVAEFDATAADKQLTQAAEASGFRIRSKAIELHGICAHCAAHPDG